MRMVKLTPKASEDLENIWHYGWQHFGEIQADRYINHLSDIIRDVGRYSRATA
ncbi:TPA: type II toxin-antitoxin system RelE/ParE family toxin [Salmonella enterica]|uniref:Type II toxin-antitoxin system RelE/ParE family toxin n=1 Tax=Salmonella enterica subsp. enterica serovar Worthington TaxID=1160769 RepID=A0A6M3NLB7_SALET|nr:type II toxin-antitoxin system RelE/ParE family toxin [Salmonella enterica subsp. enterica serovar Monschaui]EAO3020315.1 type II toxin-antitoxin system RelE/ParE family toxin [Salmonella enterica]ECD0364363.1 type II toxin-antitoxin system RelE/ParE family toxin [Salmonella enterica subsp. enterica]ECG3781378.1 type II toxin-antitoxin system RelE/ParE family toxin [Salmonella enterica subsp. enterica serovar Breukelen]QJB95181.1 type II toxin-antitoxin system RelE/ParE family toxin [Salmone